MRRSSNAITSASLRRCIHRPPRPRSAALAVSVALSRTGRDASGPMLAGQTRLCGAEAPHARPRAAAKRAESSHVHALRWRIDGQGCSCELRCPAQRRRPAGRPGVRRPRPGPRRRRGAGRARHPARAAARGTRLRGQGRAGDDPAHLRTPSGRRAAAGRPRRARPGRRRGAAPRRRRRAARRRSCPAGGDHPGPGPAGRPGGRGAGRVRGRPPRRLPLRQVQGLHPEDLAEAARRLVDKGVTVTVKDERALAAEGFGGIIGVGEGASNPPRLVELRYEPEGASARVVLVGKGITFDSGGLSLKPSEGMEAMKTDMSGAAAIVGVMSALADLGVGVAVTGYLATAENMPSGSATRQGDVLTMRNGKTVEVLNTDAEGRLVMADALALGSAGEPDAIVDVATLTGACVVALGKRYTGVVSNHDALAGELLEAAGEAGERAWRLPLPEEYRKDLDSEVADLKNVTSDRYGGALTAGLFLQEFVDGRPWVHL